MASFGRRAGLSLVVGSAAAMAAGVRVRSGRAQGGSAIADPRISLADLRVHGAHVHGAGFGRLGLLAIAEERVGIGLEAVEAALTAEVVTRATMLDVSNRLGGLDRHPANGIHVPDA